MVKYLKSHLEEWDPLPKPDPGVDSVASLSAGGAGIIEKLIFEKLLLSFKGTCK